MLSKVRFKVLALEDPRSDGSELDIGNVYYGELIEGKVYYQDRTGDDWLFYPGDTCEILLTNI